MANAIPSPSEGYDGIDEIIAAPGFRLTTSLRWSPPRVPSRKQTHTTLVAYHRKRLLESAQAFNLDTITKLFADESGESVLKKAIDAHSMTLIGPEQTYKFTLSVSISGSISITSAPAPGPLYDFSLPAAISNAGANVLPDLCLAPSPTTSSLFTRHKSNHRPMYETARAATNILHEAPTTTEVLLHNEQRQITEASLSTVYFQRRDGWVTPAASCGGNLGVTRALALDEGWCREDIVLLEDLIPSEIVILSNGVRGFWPAQLILPTI
ncbi:uncharacterized protein HMPREF1541_07764 [Cyphellophora europaea CBS 101466]|uniref:Aminodeoxychorismate lyase n=1 Tax=Cyphellophora europaea (strain CBS 101466) TaxID=1220924 RepID=W2RP92_CYPE1|nr:uncharacterized protein HMPREF1541_07764 [Cyphellophora europaea CBS 101466]ETN38140.1 hypothetical protein HMPREF1541_07764 [Cyphellophora europaea CBS 101466]